MACSPSGCGLTTRAPSLGADGDALGLVLGVCPQGCPTAPVWRGTAPSGVVPDVGDLRAVYTDTEWDALTVTQRQAALDRARSGQTAAADAARREGYVQTGANAVRELFAGIREMVRDNQAHLQAQTRNANAGDAARRSDENAARATELAGALATLRAMLGNDANPETASALAEAQRTIDALRAASGPSAATVAAVGLGVVGLGAVLYLATRPQGPARNPAGSSGVRKFFRKVLGNPGAPRPRLVRPIGHKRGCGCAVCEGQR